MELSGKAMRPWTRVVVALAVPVATMLTACSDDDKSDGGSSSDADRSTTEEVSTSDATQYIGLQVDAAGDRAEGNGRAWRVIEIDGEAQPATLDYDAQRLNFVVEDDTVVRVSLG